MRFSRRDRSVRVWFQAVTSQGLLRPGLPPGSFHVTVIDSGDAASIVPSVSESVQRPGNYYFDVPNAFMVAAGPGDYNISIEINSQLGNAGSPHVRMCRSDTLQVSRYDLDTLSGSIWDANASDHGSVGTMGDLQNMLPSIHGIENGTWVITGSQMVFYASGTMTEIARFELRGNMGQSIDPATESPFRRIRI